MTSTVRKLLGVFLIGLLAVGVTSAAFAGDNDNNSSAVSADQRQDPNDWRAAKALSDDELAQISAGAPQAQGPAIAFNFVNLGHVKVFNATINGLSATKVRVKPSVKVWTFSLGNTRPTRR